MSEPTAPAPAGGTRAAIIHVVLDCADSAALAPFWAAVLGLERTWTLGQFRGLEHADGSGPGLILQQVPEPKVGKNRVHMDLGASDLPAEIARLEGLGATRLAERREGSAHWFVMADPEGNEFCVART